MAEISLNQVSSRSRPSLPVDFYRVNSKSFGKKMIVLSLLLAAGISLALSHSVILSAVGILLIGAMFTHAVELQHQCIHRTAFKNKFWNDLTGFFLGFPMLVSYSHYRANHLHHHRTLGTKDNREFFQYNYSPSDSWLTILLTAFSLKRYIGVAKNLRRAFTGGSYENINKELETRRIALEYKFLTGFFSVAAGMSVYHGSPLILKIWLLPLFLVAEPFHFLIELPEHFRCETGNRSPLKNTRTISAGKLMFWFSNGNNYHVEHHLYPQVQNNKLPDLHQMIRSSIEHFNESYFDFFKTCLPRKSGVSVGASEAIA